MGGAVAWPPTGCDVERFDYHRIDVPRVLQALGIAAKQRRDEWWACCPAGTHSDSEPSWSIQATPGEPRHGTHHCFGCKWGGTSVDLVQHVLGYATAAMAFEWLREHAYGAPVVPTRVEVRLAPLTRSAFRMPPEYVYEPFERWPASVRDYAAQRGLNEHNVARWRVGYALYGRLAGRIVLPTLNLHQQPCSYTARAFNGSLIRYLSALDDERPDWGVLYGEHTWPARQFRQDVLVLEGALKAIAVSAVTITPVCALSGSNVLPAHVLRLSTFRRAVVVTDGDKAGKGAASALIGQLARHMAVKRVVPELDPDEVPKAQREHLVRQWLET